MGKGKNSDCCCSWCCCVGWLFSLAVIAGLCYGLLSLILGKTQRGGKFTLDSVHIESMNLSSPMKIAIELNITSLNPNRIPGLIQYDSLEFLLFFESFNIAKSATMEPFKQSQRNSIHFSSTLNADSSQEPMSNETRSALESAIGSGNLPLHLHIKIEGGLSGRWKSCDLMSNDDCYFSLTQIAPNGTGGTLSHLCSWTTGCS